MTNPLHPSLVLRPADRCVAGGRLEAASPRMGGDVWVVFHAAEGWTHLYRVDRRDPRTVHLLRCEEGDRRAAMAQWARSRLALRPSDGRPAVQPANDRAGHAVPQAMSRLAAASGGR